MRIDSHSYAFSDRRVIEPQAQVINRYSPVSINNSVNPKTKSLVSAKK